MVLYSTYHTCADPNITWKLENYSSLASTMIDQNARHYIKDMILQLGMCCSIRGQAMHIEQCLEIRSTYSNRYIFLRPVVAPYTEISGTLFWGTFIVLHRQNTLHSAQGLSKKCIIYVRVLRKHWKSKRQQLYLWVMNIDVSKITHCPCMSLCSMPIALWHIFWNLHSAESEQLDWRETGQ